MKQINKYIIEKLKINKDINTNSLIPDGQNIYTYDQFKDWLIYVFNFNSKKITLFLNNIIDFQNITKDVSYNYNDYKFLKYNDQSNIKNDFLDKKINKKIKNFKENRNKSLYKVVEDQDYCLFYTQINKSNKIRIDTAIPFIIITDKDVNTIKNIYVLSVK